MKKNLTSVAFSHFTLYCKYKLIPMYSNTLKQISLLVLILTLSGCYKDYEENEIGVIKELPVVEIENELLGTINLDNNTPAMSASVEYKGNSLALENRNYFYFRAKEVNKYFEPLTIKYKNFEFTYVMPQIENEVNYGNFVLPSSYGEQMMKSADNSSLSLESSILEFKANAYYKNDIKIAGDISIAFSSMKYENIGQYPGGSILQDQSGNLQLLIPKEFFILKSIAIDSFDAKMVLNNQSLYFFDATSNVWRKSKTILDNEYHLNKLGLYAIGNQMEYNIGYGKMSINNTTPNGETFQTSASKINQFYTTTDQGSFLCYIPKSENLNITFDGDCEKTQTSFPIVSDMHNFSNINLDIDTYKSFILKGKVKDCQNQDIAGSLLKLNSADNSSSKIKFIKESNFEISLSNCQQSTSFEVVLELLNNSESSYPHSIDIHDTTDLYDVHPCNMLKEEYLTLNIGGINSIFTNGITSIEKGRIKIEFQNPNDNSLISFYTTANLMNAYEDNDLNIVIDAKNMGSEGYELQCETSNKGCGFETFVLTEIGNNQGDYIKGYYKGRFWMKSFHPALKAGYKTIEGVFHVKRDF